jgi:Methyltransferase domain
MLSASRERIESMLSDSDLVLDVGGWAKPLARADWVIDLMPYETRGLYGEPDPDPERFSESTWLRFDICEREPWPFSDGQFDFAVCSHTLEDVRDPIWVCSELARVARAGYVEVPSRLEEQSLGVHGSGWAGWSHHHWLIEERSGALDFVFKPHVLHANPKFHFPREFGAALRPEERVVTLFWEGTLPARETIFTDAEGLDGYLERFVEEHRHLCDDRIPRSWRLRRPRWRGRTPT